jgi:hypothetical protein
VSDCVALRLLLLGLVVTWLVTGFPGLASLKGELTDHQAWPTRAAARRAIVDYIGWYNGTPAPQYSRPPQPGRIRSLSQKRDTPASSLTSYKPCPSKRGKPSRCSCAVR